MSAPGGFRRLVLELGQGASDPGTMRGAAALAGLLGAELHALFVEDEALLHASAFPFVREISVVSPRWRRLEPDRLRADLRAAAARTRRLLTEAADDAGVTFRFEVRHGDLAREVEEACAGADIVIAVPAVSLAAHALARLRAVADRQPATLLILPGRPGPARGPIVVVASGPGDLALTAGRWIAARGQERLIVLDAAALGVPVWPPGIEAALDDTKERLIVIGGDAASGAAALASARGVPVLVVR